VAPNPRRQGIYRIDAQSGEVFPIVLIDSRQEQLSGGTEWSPDGKSFYYGKIDRSNPAKAAAVFVIHDLVSGKERELIRRPSLRAVNLSPDGRFIASSQAGSRSTMLLIPTGGGEPLELMQVPEGQFLNHLMWAPDSRSIFVKKTLSATGQTEIWRMPLDGQPHKLGFDASRLRAHIVLHPDGRQVAYAVAQPQNQRKWEIWAIENFLPALSAMK
jgi:Tol biopolymer transport system component